ncbi:hypothetical protein LCGC14_1992550 [marine sediment metagenome]|uniref:Uncharacterized protein n=1 Tax=marine sediment metagenome TaxID=412755 RepID=A0A0F9I2S8_9ZZZZ
MVNGKKTRTDLEPKFDKPPLTAKQLCEAKGGTWDEARGVCILPPPTTPKVPKTEATTPEILPTPQTSKQVPLLSDEEIIAVFGTINISKSQRFQLEDAKIRGKGSIKGFGDLNAGRGFTEAQSAALAPAQAAAQSQALIEEERQRLIAEETPQRRELSPELSVGEQIPVLGGIIGTLSDFIRPLKKKLGFKTFEQLPPQDERNIALTEIARIETERGLTISEQFGKVVESVGLANIGVFGLSAKDLIETPSENAREALSNIRKERRRITNIETNVKLSYLPVEVARDQIEDIEENVIRLASRVGFLVSQSPELKFNSDFVNTMETEILQTEEKIFQAKQNILTGASIDPTEIQILQKLQEVQDEEDL